jgi:hypothetical protein
VVREREAQIRLHALADEKKTHEELLESTQKTLSQHDYSSSAVIKGRSPVVVLHRPCIPDGMGYLMSHD